MLLACKEGLIYVRIIFHLKHSKPITVANFHSSAWLCRRSQGPKVSSFLKIVLIKQHVNHGSGIAHYTTH